MTFHKPSRGDFARATAPLLFVFLWSSGWIVARYVAEYADPLSFLAVRFAVSGVALLIFALVVRANWPRSPIEWLHAMVAGVMLHAGYTGSVWWAVGHGVPASISALLAALQPIMTAALAPVLARERVGQLRWLGIGIALCGLILVLWPRLSVLAPGQFEAALIPLLVNAVGMLSLTLGTFYQKHYIRSGDLRTVTMLQYVGATVALLPVVSLLGTVRIGWNMTLYIVLAWSVLAISIGAIALLMVLIRHGEVSRAAQLSYLVPPTAAVQAYLLFGEKLDAIQLVGMALTACGVAIASRRTTRQP